jgi:hypothetical protein
MDGLLRDLRHALRNLMRSPGFTVVTVIRQPVTRTYREGVALPVGLGTASSERYSEQRRILGRRRRRHKEMYYRLAILGSIGIRSSYCRRLRL